MSTYVSLVAEGHPVVWDLPIPAWAYGAIALAVFLLLLVIAWMFRNTGHTLMTGPDVVAHGHDGSRDAHAPRPPASH